MKVNTPTMLQYEATECGAASLGMILGYYGKFCKLTELRDACGINRDGSSASKVVKAAREYDLDAKGFKYSLEELFEVKPPFIIFWKFYHFLVVEGYDLKKGVVYINDPAEGKYTVSMEEFKTSYTGVTLVMRPSTQFKKGGKIQTVWPKLVSSLDSFPVSFGIIFALGVIGVVPQLFIAGLASQFTNSFLSQQMAYFGVPIIWLSLMSVILLILFQGLNKLILRRIQYVLTKRISTNLFIKLFKTSFGFFVQRASGEVATRLLLGLTLSSSLISGLVTYAITLTSAIVVLIFTAYINLTLTAITLFVIALNIGYSYFFTEARKDDNKKFSRQQGKVEGRGLVSLSNMQMIKSCGLETAELNKWMSEYVSFNDQQQLLGQQTSVFSTFAITSKFFLNISILIVGGIQILNGNFTLGGLLAFQFLQPVIQGPIGGISGFASQLQSLDGLFGRVEDLTLEPDLKTVTSLDLNVQESVDADVGTDESSKEQVPILSIKNMNFSFGTKSNNFFEDFNLDLYKGESLAIVGGSGSGKSTLIKIIARLFEPTGGEILYKGKTRDQFGYRQFSKFLSYVTQDIFIFDSSFKNNITLWDNDITQMQVEKSTHLAELDDVIHQHPDSYNYQLGAGGSGLSGGQKQRVAIARSLARNPELILLDEATSALDNETEKKVVDNIFDEGITMISISHRLYAAMKSNYILVLENGNPVEFGNPQDLLKQKSYFYNLYTAENSSNP